MSETLRTLTLEEVGDLTRRALAACGAHGDQLDIAVQSVLDAECDGIRTVGLGYLPLYCGHLQVGKINRDAAPSHAQIAPSVVRSQADSGFAHAAYVEAEADFYALARSQGIAALSALNIASGFDLAASGFQSLDTYHLLIESMIGGRPIMARATATRCCCPTLRLAALTDSTSGSPRAMHRPRVSARGSLTRARRAGANRKGKSTLSRTDPNGNKLNC